MEIEKLYQEMFLIRKTEEKLLELFGQGKLFGTVHTCIGQEANAVGILSNININKDFVFSNHRCHGHYISLFNEVKGLLSEMMGKKTGICSGKGGSQHLQKGKFFSSGIQGGMVPIAAGMAISEKTKGNNSVVVSFIGDGTLGQGAVYETLNMISLWEIPLLLVIENNGYAQSTPINLNLAGSIPERTRAFGIKTTVLDTTNVLDIFNSSKEIIEEIRNERKPQVLVINTYRLCPHSKGDDFRDPAEIEEHRKKDPLSISREMISEEKRKIIESTCITQLEQGLDFAENSEPLSNQEFLTDLKENGILR